MRFYIAMMTFLLFFFAAIMVLIIRDTPTKQTPEESPSYWHWLDEQNPLEDMIHYLTYEEVMPGEAQE